MSANGIAFGRTLYPGTGYTSPSPLVGRLQRALARSGYGPGPIDGRFGPLTERALVHYEADRGLQVDGIAGPRTQAALSSPGAFVYPGAGYEPRGSWLVRTLQRLLATSGYALGPIDGRFGPLTERALLRYQADHQLGVDGIAGPQVFGHLLVSIRPHHLTAHRVAPVPGSAKTPAALGGASWILIAPVLIFGLLGVGSVLFAALRSGRGGSVDSVRVAGSRSDTGSNPSETTTTLRAPSRGQEIPRHAPATPAPVRAQERVEAAEKLADIPDISDALSDTNVTFNFGVLLEEQGDLFRAEGAYRLADKRGHGAAACNLGVLLEHRTDRVGALGAYRRADVRGEPDGAFNLGVLLEEQGDLRGAEAAYRRADERGHAAAASNLGVMLERQGNRPEAAAAYRRGDQRRDANAAFNLGVLLEEQGDLPGATAAYRRAEQRGHPKVGRLARAALLDLGAAPARASWSGNGAESR